MDARPDTPLGQAQVLDKQIIMLLEKVRGILGLGVVGVVLEDSH